MCFFFFLAFLEVFQNENYGQEIEHNMSPLKIIIITFHSPIST